MFLHPGQITRQYSEGKRARFLNPVQLYIFVTTIFFVLFFSFSHSNETSEGKKTEPANQQKMTAQVQPQSADPNPLNKDFEINDGFSLSRPSFASWQQYDSAQQRLPISQQDGQFVQLIYKKMFDLEKRYPNNKDFTKAYTEALLHNIPKAFFILLPFFAFLLALLFRKGNFYSVDHLIFSLHFHSFIFLLLSGYLLLDKFVPSDDIVYWSGMAILLGIGIYLFLAMKTVYGKSGLQLLFRQFNLTLFYFAGFLFTMLLLLAFTILIV